MKKGIIPIISIILIVMITIVTASAFFYWFSNIQDKAQERTATNQKVAVNTFLTQAESIVDAFYTTIEEADANAFSDFEVNLCNNGDNTIDLTAKKGVHLKEKGTEDTICAESKFDGVCIENTTYIVAGLSYNGSTAQTGVPAAIVYSTDGITWSEAGGLNVTENVMDLALFAVGVEGENPINFWAISNGTNGTDNIGRLAWAELPSDEWQFVYVGDSVNGRPGFSLSNHSGAHTLNLGVEVKAGGEEVWRVEPIFTENAVVNMTHVSTASGILNNTVTAILSGSKYFGTGGIGDNGTAMGKIWSTIEEPSENTVPGKYLRVNDFALDILNGFVYAGTTNDSSLAGSVSDVIFVLGGDTEWTSAGFNNTVNSTADVRVLFWHHMTSTDLYVGYNLPQGSPESTPTTHLVKLTPLSPLGGGDIWMPVQNWTNRTIYDFGLDDKTGYFYASMGMSNGTTNRSEIWRSGPLLVDTNWSLVYSNTERGASTALIVGSKCTKQNIKCRGCNTTLSPGDCRDLALSLEDSNCDLTEFSPETQFELDFTAGRSYTQTFNFKKEQDPANVTWRDGVYNK